MPEFRMDIERSESHLDDQESAGVSAEQPEGRRIRRKDILNLLNFINFQGGTIFVQFRNTRFDQKLSVQAFPRPCSDETLECVWASPNVSSPLLKNCVFDCLFLSDGRDLFRVSADVVGLDDRGVTFKLPDFGHEKSDRKVRRHGCAGVSVRILQNGVDLSGNLIDFSAFSCRIELVGVDYMTLRWLNTDLPVVMTLEKNGMLLFSGECVVTRSDGPVDSRFIVLTPRSSGIKRYRAREYRSVRHKLVPAPNIFFEHPLTGKRVSLQATDLSSSGFAAEEFHNSSTLFPGLIIPEISVEIGNSFLLKCRGQVLYRNLESHGQGEPLVKCGVVFLDMDLGDQAELSALLQQAGNNRMRVCNRVDMDELWRFFFDSGFIYPSKYVSLQNGKDEFKRTYEKLYLKSPSIARHFIFQDRGVLFGHMSMIRNHARTWLIHHHAAARSGYGMAGVAVLDQVGQYINEFHMHHATRMDYVMCYYRQENRFPSRVFGGVAKDAADPKASSVDVFAYSRTVPPRREGADAYQLMPAKREDLTELERFYEAESGGLALEALNLGPRQFPDTELNSEYERNGFTRGRAVFSLKRNGALLAVIMITRTEAGLNLSNLTNCVHAFVIRGEDLLQETFVSAISDVCEHYEKMEIPLLVYPASYLEAHSVPFDKQYLLWVLNMKNSDGYFKSLRNTFRRLRFGSEHSPESNS